MLLGVMIERRWRIASSASGRQSPAAARCSSAGTLRAARGEVHHPSHDFTDHLAVHRHGNVRVRRWIGDDDVDRSATRSIEHGRGVRSKARKRRTTVRRRFALGEKSIERALRAAREADGNPVAHRGHALQDDRPYTFGCRRRNPAPSASRRTRRKDSHGRTRAPSARRPRHPPQWTTCSGASRRHATGARGIPGPRRAA